MVSKTWQEQCGDFAFETVARLVGGDARAYFGSEQTLAQVWAECHRNEIILNLSALYLVGSSERASGNLDRLRAKLVDVFGLVIVEQVGA